MNQLLAARRTIAVVLSFLMLVLGSAAARAQDFPVTIAHKYGSTTIAQKPQRVVSLGFSQHDDILALGVVPIAIRWWYGEYERGVWPWAEAALGDAEPVVLKGDLNIEQIAALQPDLILGIGSGITAEQYALLSQIAPTVAPEAQYGDYGTPWQAGVRTMALALGESPKAEDLIGGLEQRMSDIATAHPEWHGQTAAVAFYWNDAPGAYRSIDPRPRLLERLGFVTPQAIDDLGADDAFFASFSSEDLSPIDTDLLIWFDEFEAVSGLTLRPTLRAYREGREIFAGDLLSAAFSHSSLLSLDYVLDELPPLIELAVDGDPATVVPNGDGSTPGKK